ncbi:hypothetical protein [uncultured Ferrovibrio sp.]|jgi:hypothetical protein|nr:hypothetical protein [uncultured Ferrovibrio sp.]
MSTAEQVYFAGLIFAFLAFAGGMLLGMITSSHAPPAPVGEDRARSTPLN